MRKEPEKCPLCGKRDMGPGIVKAANELTRLRAEVASLKAQGETAWLIEMIEPEDNKAPYPRWWHPETGWTWDANNALRFAREIDAADYMKRPSVLGTRWLYGKPTEHQFIGDAP